MISFEDHQWLIRQKYLDIIFTKNKWQFNCNWRRRKVTLNLGRPETMQDLVDTMRKKAWSFDDEKDRKVIFECAWKIEDHASK